ncbi:estradiol 17-beta-dehydrogenase 8-like isoform X2 [Odontomachus brunneus]|uniref:estradiol 17-beta-dehydrogenase 8-like isoform X2 n=1 Tax=Odontomachus brunneus TaxID=486640 RepID=UPI0013F1A4F2|nr:estradiol 17-beta-dehydrogenase 8-like isoform X2 [Odontomachus brunneus]
MSKLLAGKLALVTGAGSGIGMAVCRVLAREGAKVVATDQNVKNVRETVNTLEGTGHVALHMQVAERASVETTFKDVKKQFSKPPTIIVNSAGIITRGHIINFTDKDFDEIINVNLKGIFLVMQAAVKAMIEADTTKGSSIVNISSIVAKQTFPMLGIYSATKAGVISITKTASKEFGKLGIRVNTVLPGYIETPMVLSLSDEEKQGFLKQIALRRSGQPQEVAELIAFLVSDNSSYVNGADIDITGGK